jgi:hypothetical protein
MSLFAPLAVAVELKSDDERRAFRLSRSVGPTGLRLERPAPFEVGRAVTVAFSLPDDPSGDALVMRAVIVATDADGDGEHGGRALEFIASSGDGEDGIVRYVRDRLGLPGSSSRQ